MLLKYGEHKGPHTYLLRHLMSHEYLSKIKDEFNANFQIGAQNLQACNASIAHNNQQIEYLLYENQIRKHEMEIMKQNSQKDMNKLMLLERTLTEERKQREQSDLILASKIADLTNERNILMSYTKEIKKQYPYSVLYTCIICSEEKRNTKMLPCNHVVTCKNCTADIMKKDGKCPVCRMEIRKVIWP